MKTIEYRMGYKVGRRWYVSLRGALRYYALSKLSDKYGWFSEVGDLPHAKLECICPDRDNEGYYEINANRDWPGCPIHDRKNGYFARVAYRFTRRYNHAPQE